MKLGFASASASGRSRLRNSRASNSGRRRCCTSKPIAYDVGCGYGGWSEALIAAGYDVTGFDINPKAEKRYPGRFVYCDVRYLDGRKLRGAQLIVGSMPCQPFSTANTQTRDPAAGMGLVREFMRVVEEAQPKYWCMENVRGSVKAISAEYGPPLNQGGMNHASVYLWGRIPPTLIPRVRKGWTLQRAPNGSAYFEDGARAIPPSHDALENSVVPFPIAFAVAGACLE